MSSWPGFSRAHSELALFAEDLWPDHRSEIYVPRCPSSTGSSFGQRNGVYKGAILLSSTDSGTLPSISPLPSEPSFPRTTSTAPVNGYKTAEENGRCEDIASISRPLIKDQQRERFPSSPQHSCFGDHAAAPAQDNSAKLTNLLDEVLNLHEEVSTKRYRARDLRHTLRQKREEEHDLRMALRNALNLVSPDSVHSEASAINNAIQSLQTVTDSYLVLEEEYHRFEDELGQREYLLEKRMTRLNRTLRKQIPPLRQARDLDYDADSSADYVSGDEIDIPPREAEYLSLVGDSRMLRERLTELEGEYLAIIDQREMRERIGISLDAEALAFLDSYVDEKAQIESELDLVLRRVQAHPGHTKEPTPAALEAEWQEVLKAYLPEPPEDQPPPDRLCSSEFEDRSPFFETARPFSMDKAAFINKWLLHRLRHSRVEVLRLKSRPELMDLVHQGWNGDTISQMALMLWFRDETAQMVRLRSNSAG